MSERGYFSLRYIVPGYTFILLIVGINYVPLLEILSIYGFESVFTTILAFLSLLSGAAIGFLISQFWWWLYQQLGGPRWMRRTIHALNDTYGLEPTSDDDVITSVFDYLSYSDQRKTLLTFASRRWDIYHLLSSTICTLWIGWVLGILCRFYYEIFLFNLCPTRAGFWAEFWPQVFIVICVVLLTLFLLQGRQLAGAIIDRVSAARIRTSGVQPEEIRRAFPEVFEQE